MFYLLKTIVSSMKHLSHACSAIVMLLLYDSSSSRLLIHENLFMTNYMMCMEKG